MKKLIILTISFLVLFLAIIITPFFVTEDAISVGTVTPDIIDFELICSANGVIKKSDNISVTFDYDVVVKEYKKKIGDRVNIGDTILIIDKDKTIELLKSSYTSEQIALYQDYINSFPVEITSEYDGVITSINQSEIVYKGDILAEISVGSGYVANVYILEKDISNIKLGQKAKIFGKAFKDKEYIGEIISISNEATEKTVGNQKETVVNALIEILNPDNGLKDGFNVTADIIYGEIKDALTIPYDALREDNNSYYVYKLYNGNFGYKSRVDILYEENDYVVINGNLSENSKLCVTTNNSDEKIVRVNVNNEDIKY